MMRLINKNKRSTAHASANDINKAPVKANKKNIITIYECILFCIIGIGGRIMPHLPDMTPMLSLSVISHTRFKLWLNHAMLIFIMLLSNLLLAYLHHYPVFGYWSLGSTLGLIAIHHLARYTIKNQPQLDLRSSLPLLGKTLLFSIAYWAWLNAQTWLCTNLYPMSCMGFLQAQYMGLPFLANMMIGDGLFLCLIFIAYCIAERLNISTNRILITDKL